MYETARSLIKNYAQSKTDISEHLLTLFDESVSIKPKLIVELGTRGGESTKTFAEVAKIYNSFFVSVDMEDCATACDYKDWRFVKDDDVRFAKKFDAFCKENNIIPQIDILFIDTSHKYWHTRGEIKHWLPHLSQNGKIMFHDTNLKVWDNKRGVIRAIEKLVGTKFDENYNFELTFKKWHIKHFANCNGLTIVSYNPAALA